MRLITWDTLQVRLDGAKVDELFRQTVGTPPPIEKMELQFHNGLLRVVGVVRKFIAVPFKVDITEIHARGTTIRVPLKTISAGGLPIPTLLVGLVRSKLPREMVQFEEPATLVVSLDRFLPPFVTVDVQKIWIIDGGLMVTLGRGGADLPPGAMGGSHGRKADG